MHQVRQQDRHADGGDEWRKLGAVSKRPVGDLLDREIQRGLDDIKAGRVCDGPSYFRELEEELDREEQAQGK